MPPTSPERVPRQRRRCYTDTFDVVGAVEELPVSKPIFAQVLRTNTPSPALASSLDILHAARAARARSASPAPSLGQTLLM